MRRSSLLLAPIAGTPCIVCAQLLVAAQAAVVPAGTESPPSPEIVAAFLLELAVLAPLLRAGKGAAVCSGRQSVLSFIFLSKKSTKYILFLLLFKQVGNLH